jgi:hypothetical protein
MPLKSSPFQWCEIESDATTSLIPSLPRRNEEGEECHYLSPRTRPQPVYVDDSRSFLTRFLIDDNSNNFRAQYIYFNETDSMSRYPLPEQDQLGSKLLFLLHFPTES